jgi:hypothetical protein
MKRTTPPSRLEFCPFLSHLGENLLKAAGGSALTEKKGRTHVRNREWRTYIERKIPRYYKIYEQIYDDPLVRVTQIAKKSEIARSTVSRDIMDMCNLSIMGGPAIALKPAQNYHLYVRLLKFEHPVAAFKCFSRFPSVMTTSLSSGEWNLMLISRNMSNLSELEGFRKEFYHGVKGVTCVPKVTTLDWELSMKKIQDAISSPEEKSFLYSKVPKIPWKEKEWTLYDKFRENVRVKAESILKECRIRREWYSKWIVQLTGFANVCTVFYPKGFDRYFALDFLFESEYQKQLTDVLGMLPSSSIFFSVGEYLLARLFFLNNKEKDDLLCLIFQLGCEKYYTRYYQAVPVSPGLQELMI